MATALDIITRSMRLCKALGTNEEPTSDEATDALNALNTMLEMWSLERLLVYRILRTTKTLTANVGSYSIGAAGDIVLTVPPSIEDSNFVRDSSIDYPVKLIDEQSYQALGVKSVAGVPQFLFYDRRPTLAYINLYPVPSKAYVLNLATWQPMQSFTDLTTVLDLPLGYKRMIEYNLALELSSEFGVEPPMQVAKIAGDSKTVIKRINAPNYVLRPESAYIASVAGSDINTLYG